MNLITFSQALDGYLLSANARHLSPNTILDYVNNFNKFLNFLDQDPPIESITVRQVERFLADQNVSIKTVLNYQIGLSALWIWAKKEEIVQEHVLHKVKRIKPEKRAIKPYTEDDIRNMLNSQDHTRIYSRPGKRDTSHRLVHADRNRAIIFILLDTGISVSELTNLKLQEADI